MKHGKWASECEQVHFLYSINTKYGIDCGVFLNYVTLIMSTVYYKNIYKIIKKIWLVTEHRSYRPRTDCDSAWKNMLYTYFREGMELFFPALAPLIDWTQPVVFLDGELQKIAMDGETGRRTVDVLVKVACKKDGPPLLLLHWEVQGAKTTDFAQRVYTYHSRIADRYHIPVSSLVVFTDANSAWRPDVYEYRAPGVSLRFAYSIAKLLKYKSDRVVLEQSDNPFAIVVLTHLASIRVKNNHNLRLESKIALMRHVYTMAKKCAKENEWVRNLINFIDFVFPLKGQDAVKYHGALLAIEQETHMTYIESLEQMAEQRGIQLGIQKGIEQGIEQGVQKGLEQGIKKMILSMLKKGFPEKVIMELAGLTGADFNILKQQGAETA